MSEERALLLEQAARKSVSAINLVMDSVERLEPYDDTREYTSLELEPYDALSDRFIRAVEVCIRFFRSLDIYESAVEAETYRELLNRMEKIGIVSSVELWMDMRDVRNRIVHDYLPEEAKSRFDDIMYRFSDELKTILYTLKKPGSAWNNKK